MGPAQADAENGHPDGDAGRAVAARIRRCAHLPPLPSILLLPPRIFRAVVQHHGADLVQLNALTEIRGRVVGLFNMAGAGMRAFSGITVGLIGLAIGIHWSLGVSAAVLLMLLAFLYRLAMRAAIASGTDQLAFR